MKVNFPNRVPGSRGAPRPHELLRALIRYKHVDCCDPALLQRAYERMKARGMTAGRSEQAALAVG